MFAVIRVRGKVNIRSEVENTLKMLRLNRVNHCVILPETPEFMGMLKKVKDWTTYGRIEKKTLVKLLQARGKLKGNKKLNENALKKVTKYDSFEKFSEDLIKGKIKLKEYPQIKPVFRLNPPIKGYKAIRLPYPMGDLGNRGEKINELLERMI